MYAHLTFEAQNQTRSFVFAERPIKYLTFEGEGQTENYFSGEAIQTFCLCTFKIRSNILLS